MGVGGELRPKKICLKGQNGLSAAFLSLIFSSPSFVSCKRFQSLMVGEGKRSFFKFLVELFVLLCKLPDFSLKLGTVQMRLGMCNLYTVKSVKILL